MSVDIDEYKRQLEEFTKKAVPQSAIDYQMAIVRQLYMFMVTFTPVDTGALRGNWKVSVGRKPTGSSKSRKTDATQTGAPPTAKEIAQVTAIAKTLKVANLGQTVWIGNLVNYAKFIEFGYTHVSGKKMKPFAMMQKARHSTLEKIISGNVRWQNIGS